MTVIPPLAAPTGTSRGNLLRTFRSSAAAAVVRYGVNLAIVPFVLHRVGSDLYGAWATMASILAVGALADAGVRTEIIRRVGVAQGAGDEEEVVRSVGQGVTLLVALAGAVTLLGALAAPAVRGFAFPEGVPGYGNAEIDLLIRATVALLAASLVANGYFGVLRGVQRGDVETTGLMLSVPASAATTVAGVWLGWGLWGLFLGSLTGLLVTVAWNRTGTRKLVPDLRMRLVALSGPVVKGYVALSGLALMSQIGDVVDSQWDKIVLSRYVGSTAVTSFQIGTQLVLQGKALALLPLAPLLVVIAELRHHDLARMEKLFDLMTRVGMVLGAVVLGAIFVFAPAFLRLWLDNDPSAAAAGDAARLFSIAAALNLVSAPQALRAFGEGWHALCAVSSVANMVVNGTMSLVLTMAIGFNGALYGSIGGTLVGSSLLFVLMRRRMGGRWTPPPLRAVLTGAFAVLVAVAAGLSRIDSWVELLPMMAVYVVVVLLVCSRAERVQLGQLLSRRVPA